MAVLFLIFIISGSGILINFLKRGRQVPVHLVQDEGSLFWFRVLVPASLIIAITFWACQIGHIALSGAFVLTGFILVALGLLIRWIAVLSLGRAFTVEVTILEDHRLVTNGIYRLIRHPSYTGLLLYYLGLGLVMANWVSLLVLVLGPWIAVLHRIRIEEKVLLQYFLGQYEDYQLRSWRLFPYLY